MRVDWQRVLRRCDVIAVLVLAGWLAFDLTSRTFFGSVPWPESVVDYHILYHYSLTVVETHQYPVHYPYPPPAIVLHAGLATLPYPAAAALWVALTGLAAAAVYLMLARALELHRKPGLLLLLPAAHLLVSYYVQWDMRSVNCNLIMLAAVVLGCLALSKQREALAGFCFALAIALKVIPVLLVPYLAWTRRWRAFAWAAACSLIFWVAVPLLTFGPSGLVKVYSDWGGQLNRVTDLNAKAYHPILISLDKAAHHIASQHAVAAGVIVGSVWVLWVCIGLAGAAASRIRRTQDSFSILTHTSLLIIGPAAVNPYLEPYHLVALIVPAVLLFSVAADSEQRRWLRIVSAAAVLCGLAIMKYFGSWHVRGLQVNAEAIVLCGAAVLAAWARSQHRAGRGTEGSIPAASWQPRLPRMRVFR